MPRGSYKSRDGKQYPLWTNIDEVMDAVMPAYWSNTRETRRERGWMFRGQSNDQWDMVPSLYRPPATPEVIAQRKAYTEAFVNDLVKNAGRLGLKDLYDDKLMAIAQHYGLYTPYLDFTWNCEVAAYFATKDPAAARIGVIYAYNIREYEQLRNPFAVLGVTQEETDGLFREHGMGSLPITKTVEFCDIPRIYAQEGLFIEVKPDDVETFMRECVDRFYFYQQKGKTYTGQHESWRHAVPSKAAFDSETTYQSFVEMLRAQMPGLFQGTPEFGDQDLFPPLDPISEFAEKWKHDHPDPLRTTYERHPVVRVETPRADRRLAGKQGSEVDIHFEDLMNACYFDLNWKTPYCGEVMQKGRLLIEKMSQRPELNNLENLKWLVWELLNSYLKEQGYPCTLELGMKAKGPPERGPFCFMLGEGWLGSNYRFEVPFDEIQKGWWCGRFDDVGRHRLKLEDLKLRDQPLSKAKGHEIAIGNPYSPSGTIGAVLEGFLAEMQHFADGERGSCVFDMQSILVRAIGRQLEVGLGLENTKTCSMVTPLVQPEHNLRSPQLVVEVYDGFLRKLKRASLCDLHWHYLGKADVDMLDPAVEVRVVLA